ncbi:hypothetical protein HY485_01435 [Candidatus Woesearchaeota archaeon]|nr:hypothetical protein [Candidatus Woesearchaeota archaeon]
MTNKQDTRGVDEGLFYSLQNKEKFAEKVAAHATFADNLIKRTSRLSTRNATITTPTDVDKLNLFNPYSSVKPSETVEEKSEQTQITPVQQTTESLETLTEKPQEYAAQKEPEKTYEKKPAQATTKSDYLSLSEITKIPGTKSLAMLNNVVLRTFRKDHPELCVEHRDGKTKKTLYAAVEKLFEYILKDTTKASGTVKNYKDLIKETEKAAFTSLVDRLIESSDIHISVEEICRLPGTKSYHALRDELSDYVKNNPDNRKQEIKKSAEPKGKSALENKYKLTEKLVDAIFKDPNMAAEIKYWLNEKHKPKKTVEELKTETIKDKLAHEEITPEHEPVKEISDPDADFAKQAILQTFAPLPQPYTPPTTPSYQPPDQHTCVVETKSKKQLKREQEELRREEIRGDIVRKLITLKKIGRNTISKDDVPKGLPPHEKSVGNDIVKEGIRDDTFLAYANHRISINPKKLGELNRKYPSTEN